MIVVDTSAIITIHAREPNYRLILARLMARSERFIPATAVVEATMVLSRAHKDPKAQIDHYMTSMALKTVPADEAVVVAAQDAFLRFGKGRHLAKLNLCDCFSYATAKVLNMPLLFIGNDFPQTDIQTV